MNLQVIILGIIETVFALIFGPLYIFIAYKLFLRLTKNIDEEYHIKNNNIAVGILVGAVIFGIVYVVSAVLEPVTATISQAIRTVEAHGPYYVKIFVIILLNLIISGGLALFAIFFSFKIFSWLTKRIKEIEELKNKNIAVAIVLAFIIISIALFIRPGINMILDGLIPLPEIYRKPITM